MMAQASVPDGMAETPRRPHLAIRIGVTGSVVLPAERLAELRDEVMRALGIIKAEVELVAHSSEAHGLYDTDRSPKLILTSSLAEGADRLIAHAGLDSGFDLRAVLPFTREEYAKDCRSQESLDDYKALLNRAEGGIVELDGARDEYEIDSYEAAGHLTVRTSDLMIAVWDLSPGRRAGTEWVMRYAQRQGVPVWWIHTDGSQPPTLILGQTRLSGRVAAGQEAVMAEYLRRLLVPPRPAPEYPSALLEWFGRISQSLAPEPARVYLASKPKRDRWYWRVYTWWLGTNPPPGAESKLTDDYWTTRMAHADRRANDYGQRVRSGYFWVSALTLLSVVIAVMALSMHGTPWESLLIVAEVIPLGFVSALLFGRHWHDWTRRWQDHRRLAEALRSRQLLTLFTDETAGWSRHVIHTLVRSTGAAVSTVTRSLWVEWMVSAYARAAPTPSVCYDQAAKIEAQSTAIAFLRDQKAYHEFSADRAHRADSMVRWFDDLLLPTIIALIVFKLILVLVLPDHQSIGILGFVAIVLPVLALNIVSVRAAWHLHLHSVRSRAMAETMDAAMFRLNAVDITLALTSQDLSVIAAEIADAMAQDTDVRIELSEAG